MNDILYIRFWALIRVTEAIISTKRCISNHERYYGKSEADWQLKKRLEYQTELEILEKMGCDLFKTSNVEELIQLMSSEWPQVLDYLIANNGLYDYKFVDLLRDKNLSVIPKLLPYYKAIYYTNKAFSKDHYYACDYVKPIYSNILMLVYSTSASEVISIYKDLLDNNLYNPNGICGTSMQNFWHKVPNPDSEFNDTTLLSYSRKVILDSRTDYYELSNGSCLINGKLRSCQRDTKVSIDYKEYSIDLLKSIIIDKNFSVIDTFRTDNGKFYDSSYSLIVPIFSKEYDYDDSILLGVKDLRNYLLSFQGINRQIEAARAFTIGRNDTIDFYIDLIQKQYRIDDSLEIQKLKYLKI